MSCVPPYFPFCLFFLTPIDWSLDENKRQKIMRSKTE